MMKKIGHFNDLEEESQYVSASSQLAVFATALTRPNLTHLNASSSAR